MGTDIHMYAEKKINDEWIPVGKVFKSVWIGEGLSERVYDSRNYYLFTAICGVRKKFESDTIVDRNRGLPNDLSSVIKNEFGTDYFHDTGYATLTELLNYNWYKEVEVIKICTFSIYKKYVEHGEDIDCYCSYTSAETIDEETAKRMIRNNIDFSYVNPFSDANPYVRVKQMVKISDYVDDFYNVSLPKLCQISTLECDGESDDVRVVFGFDS